MSLKTFIIKEELNAEHSARFLLFKERYHTLVLVDLKKSLETEWTKDVKALSKRYKIEDEDLQLALLKNPKAVIQMLIEPKDEKIISSRHRETIEISPSVKIPLLYKKEERDLMIQELLRYAEVAIKNVASNWDEIFNIEKKGRASAWFKIVHDNDEIRFQLALSDNKQETYKTLYSIRVEYGKVGSKTKDFDRVYLHSF